MRYSTLKEERKLWKRGYKFVACIDEVGRGPLAGPVVACAVAVLPKPSLGVPKLGLGKLRDSKKLSTKKRGEIYNKVKEHPRIQWGIGVVGEKLIDRINIYQATRLAMKRALGHVKRKADFLILDGNMKLDVVIPQKAIVKADEKVFSCAVASVIAKVTRDRMMVRYHKKYPQYGFHKHKGYGTVLHLKRLRQYGPCPIHRTSFAPVTTMLKSEIRNSKQILNPKF